MKTTKLFTLAVAACCTLGASAMAADKPANRHQKRIMKPAATQRATWDKQQNVVLRTVGYPVVYLGRAGHTLIDSPQIVGQTFKGQRTVFSKNGLFARKDVNPEMNQPGHRVAQAPEASIANRRG